ncbi:MAG TPA: hypothetical protein VKP30_27845, partial [Polyangiaceae bacterium]|nr:hypothetical protein [Polyangiaceae bacterium]
SYKLYDTTVAKGALMAASDGTVWVTGSTNFAAAQFDGSGNELQRIMVASDGNPGWGSGQAIRTLSNGDVLIAGVLKRPVDFGGGMLGAAADTFSSGFLARFTPSGQYVTSQIFGQNTGVDGMGLAVGADGGIVLSGNLNGAKSIFGCSSTAQMAPGFVAKLDEALQVQWATLIPAGVSSPEIDPQGNIFIATKTPANVYLGAVRPIRQLWHGLVDASGCSGWLPHCASTQRLHLRERKLPPKRILRRSAIDDTR